MCGHLTPLPHRLARKARIRMTEQVYLADLNTLPRKGLLCKVSLCHTCHHTHMIFCMRLFTKRQIACGSTLQSRHHHLTLMWSISCCQWRVLIAGFLRSVISGIVFLKASMVSLSHSQTGHDLTSWPILITNLLRRAAASSMTSAC